MIGITFTNFWINVTSKQNINNILNLPVYQHWFRTVFYYNDLSSHSTYKLNYPRFYNF